MGNDIDLLGLIADDKNMIAYRPSWNRFTGSVNGTILLQQVVYRWVQSGRRPFFKFSRPCKQRAYRVGDSWQEELGMGRREFENARKGLACRTRGNIDPNTLISYWVTADRKTWYALNESLMIQKLQEIYPDPEITGVGIQTRLDLMDETAISMTTKEPAGVDDVGQNTRSGTISGGKNGRSGPKLMDETAISSAQNGLFTPELMDETAISPMDETAITANGANVHSRMDETAISAMDETAICYSKDNNRDNLQRQQAKTTAETSEELSTGTAVTDIPAATAGRVLQAAKVVGRPYQELLTKPPELILAWFWHCQLEQMEQKYVPGYLVNQLREDVPPPENLADLAGRWLRMDQSDQEILRSFSEQVNVRAGVSRLSEAVPENYFRDLYAESLDAFDRLYRVGAYGIGGRT